MAKKGSGCGTALFIFLAICGITVLFSDGEEQSTSNISSPTPPPSNVDVDSIEETVPYEKQIVDCDLGQCGNKQLTREECSTYICCQAGTTYTIVSNQSSCTAKQKEYIESITPAPTPSTYSKPSYNTTTTTCCKVCTKGKACGDTCISRSYTCHKGPGCACDR